MARTTSVIIALLLFCSCHSWRGIPVGDLRDYYQITGNVSLTQLRSTLKSSLEESGYTINDAASLRSDVLITNWIITENGNRVQRQSIQFFFTRSVDDSRINVRGDVFIEDKFSRDPDREYKPLELTKTQEHDITEPILSSAIRKLR